MWCGRRHLLLYCCLVHLCSMLRQASSFNHILLATSTSLQSIPARLPDPKFREMVKNCTAGHLFAFPTLDVTLTPKHYVSNVASAGLPDPQVQGDGEELHQPGPVLGGPRQEVGGHPGGGVPRLHRCPSQEGQRAHTRAEADPRARLSSLLRGLLAGWIGVLQEQRYAGSCWVE